VGPGDGPDVMEKSKSCWPSLCFMLRISARYCNSTCCVSCYGYLRVTATVRAVFHVTDICALLQQYVLCFMLRISTRYCNSPTYVRYTLRIK
jgi:hypothetical protein